MTFKEHFYSLIIEGLKDLNSIRKRDRKILYITKLFNDEYRVLFRQERTDRLIGDGIIEHDLEFNYCNFHLDLESNMQHKGYGPLIYDVVIEFVTNYLNSFLVSSQTAGWSTSDKAKNVYRYYVNKRSDIEKTHISELNISELEIDPENSFMNFALTKEIKLIPKMLEKGTLIIN